MWLNESKLRDLIERIIAKKAMDDLYDKKKGPQDQAEKLRDNLIKNMAIDLGYCAEGYKCDGATMFGEKTAQFYRCQHCMVTYPSKMVGARRHFYNVPQSLSCPLCKTYHIKAVNEQKDKKQQRT